VRSTKRQKVGGSVDAYEKVIEKLQEDEEMNVISKENIVDKVVVVRKGMRFRKVKVKESENKVEILDMLVDANEIISVKKVEKGKAKRKVENVEEMLEKNVEKEVETAVFRKDVGAAKKVKGGGEMKDDVIEEIEQKVYIQKEVEKEVKHAVIVSEKIVTEKKGKRGKEVSTVRKTLVLKKLNEKRMDVEWGGNKGAEEEKEVEEPMYINGRGGSDEGETKDYTNQNNVNTRIEGGLI
jgi:hypothetical protein